MSVAASSLVIGRDAELARLESGLRIVPCAVILGLPGVGKSALARQLAMSWSQPVRVHHASEGGSLAGLVDDLRRELGIGAAQPLSSEPDRFTDLADQLDRGAHLWLIEDADRIEGVDRLLTALSAELRRRDAQVAIGADVHFYASREYNSMLTVIGVIPYEEQWMVFVINQTFTDQVLGFGSSVRRSMGRNLMATELGKQLAETRRRLATGSK